MLVRCRDGGVEAVVRDAWMAAVRPVRSVAGFMCVCMCVYAFVLDPTGWLVGCLLPACHLLPIDNR